MNVAAREPAVGTYTLLVQSNQIALVPLQAPSPNVGEPIGGSAPTLSGQQQVMHTGTSTTPRAPSPSRAAAGAGAGLLPTSRPSEQAAKPTQAIMSQQQISQGAKSTTMDAEPPTTLTSTSSAIATTRAPPTTARTASNNNNNENKNQQPNTSNKNPHSPGPQSPAVGKPCPREAHDNFCLNKGTCVLIEPIDEYMCK